MIDTEALRKKVIDLAIQGKLTEQLQSDGDAETLYAQILDRKSQLIKEGKIKKDKALPDIAADEIPFETPQNWKWVRLGTIITLQSGQDLNATDYNSDNNGIPYITGASNYRDDGTLIINRWTDSPKAYAIKGDILLSCKGTVGKLTILDEEEVHIARQIMGIRTYLVSVKFIRYFVDCMLERIKSASKGLIPGIERNDILNLSCPLPPLAEQKRIVEKIEDILAQIDIVDDLQAKYSNDLAVLKSKIIDAGIQGKLTEQLPEDGDAEDLYAQILNQKSQLIKEGKIKKNKALPDIAADEIPFEIPKNWKWVRLQDISDTNIGLTYHPENVVEQGTVVLRSNNIKNGQFDYSDLLKVNCDIRDNQYIDEGDILICSRNGSKNLVGKCAVYDGKLGRVSFGAFMAILRTQFNRFLYYYLTTDAFRRYFSNDDTKQINQVTQDILKKAVVPLPPLDEQKRIVEKIDAILEQINS